MVATRARPSTRETAFGGEIELWIPFAGGEELREALKDAIPKRFRTWDPDNKVWRVMGAYAPTAIDLLLEHFPAAEVPDDAPRRLPSTPARTEKPPAPLPLPPLDVATSANDQTSLDPLLAIVPCPTCGHRHEQPLRVVAETSLTVTKRESITPELVAVCPGCHTLAVVSFFPAPMPVAS